MSFQTELAKRIFYWCLSAIGGMMLMGSAWVVRTVVSDHATMSLIEYKLQVLEAQNTAIIRGLSSIGVIGTKDMEALRELSDNRERRYR